MIFVFGNAFWRSATPAPVTLVAPRTAPEAADPGPGWLEAQPTVFSAARGVAGCVLDCADPRPVQPGRTADEGRGRCEWSLDDQKESARYAWQGAFRRSDPFRTGQTGEADLDGFRGGVSEALPARGAGRPRDGRRVVRRGLRLYGAEAEAAEEHVKQHGAEADAECARITAPAQPSFLHASAGRWKARRSRPRVCRA
jgi:hypothetical protein